MAKKKKNKKLKEKILAKAVKSVNPVRKERRLYSFLSKRKRFSNGVKITAEKTNKEPDGVKKTKIRVIGIGGGAGNIVSEIASRLKYGSQPTKASFVVANTDLQALRATKRNTIRFQFGENFTRGLGAGMNVELAETAAQTEKEKIKKLFQGQDLCILVASLGGGTGSGAGPIFAKIAKNLGIITLGVFTLPFKFEGERKLEIARDALLKLKPNLNAISILPNERIFQIIDKSTPLKEAFSSINKSLAESLQGLIEMIYLPGLINIDFADLRAILQGKGRLAFLNAIEVEGANRLAEAIKKVLVSPLYPYTIKGAKGVLFDIAGEKGLSLSEVSQISKTISELVNPEAKIIFGISESKKYQNKIKVTLLATGCSAKIFSEEAKKPKTSVIRALVKGEDERSSSISKKKRRQKHSPKPIRKETKAGEKIKPPPKKIKSVKKSSEIGASARVKEDKSSSSPTEALAEVKKSAKKSFSSFVSSSTQRAKFSSPFAAARVNKLAKKIKIKISQKPREKEVLPAQKPGASAEVDELSSSSPFAAARVSKEDKSSSSTTESRLRDEGGKEREALFDFAAARVKEEIKIRKNALQIKKETEEMEKEYMEKEKIWEPPAFLRLRPKKLPFNPSRPKEENSR